MHNIREENISHQKEGQIRE